MFSTQTDNDYIIKIPMSFNDYNIVDYIDNGAFSAVLKVQDKISNQFFAAKVISINDMNSKNQLNMIRNEIDILSSVSHPNIIQIYNWFNIKNSENEEFIVIIEEYCENGNLVKYLNSGLKNERVIKKLEIGLINAIQYLHDIGIAHCDIKPDNVLIGDDFSAKLCDFGFSKIVNLSDDSTRWGTLGFNAPEIYELGFVDFIKADIWSLGITLYEISELRFPFENFDDAKKGDLLILTDDEKLQIVVEKCTRIQPEKRPAAIDLLEEKYYSIVTNIIDEEKIFEIKSKCNYKTKSYCFSAKRFCDSLYSSSSNDEIQLNSFLSLHNEYTEIEKYEEKYNNLDYEDKICFIVKRNNKNKRNSKKNKKHIKSKKKFEKRVKKRDEINNFDVYYFNFIEYKKSI